MERLTTIAINKQAHNFSAAHFTIFSATERERLHGHNYAVSARIVAPVNDNGLTVDYNLYKDKIKALCDALDEYTLIPAQSPHLEVAEEGEYYRVVHNGDVMLFLQNDTQLLPMRNTTIEEFSYYLLQQLLQDGDFLRLQNIREVEILVSSGPGQTGSASWSA